LPPADAGGTDGAAGASLDAGGDADASFDGAADASNDGGVTDASDAGGGDGASGCTPDPTGDSQCAGGMHMYRCVGLSYQPPVNCRLLSVGNLSAWYCCP
jgi:hypothetical protein